uniref:Uncharacterized protein n=1 Tax=Glossina austeni TaxID=7395 RepID=A0A1A9UNQ7_GLOAU
MNAFKPILVLLDWELNILESVTMSTAIGLAVDFSLHYGIHYRSSPTCASERCKLNLKHATSDEHLNLYKEMSVIAKSVFENGGVKTTHKLDQN